MVDTPRPSSPAEEIGATDAGDRQRGSGARAVPPSSGIMPGVLWGRYRVRSQIGQGGMGTVYAADDSTLGRKVALKLLRYDDPAQVERFLQEAKAQAQVDNQHVCRVYEVGEVRGRPYIAMQFLEGEPLHRAAEHLTLEEKIVVMRQVCDGVHAAHRLGLIHRDIKPGNIMVERGDDRQPKAFICDFGLAREMGARGMTVTGLALGTPEYMAPEQAFGDTAKLDRRTDVYGLGATLYEILSGRKPYEGERSAEIFAKLLESDPRPLLEYEPGLPVDLQTIVMKCMERDPHRRYETARALHDDLGRFLDGEPIDARPATITYRLGKKIRKNKTLSIVLAASLVLVVAVAALALRGEWQARKRALLAQRYGLVAKEIEGVMRYGHLLPLHDTRREGAMVRQRMSVIRMEMVDQGDLAVGAGRYALGRGHLALQEYEPARRELEEAWRLGYRGPDVAYALAQALGELYRRAAEEVRAAEEPAQRAAAQADVDRRFKEPLKAYLADATGLQTEAPEYVEGLVAFYDGRYSAAIEKARVTLRRLPWFYEAAKLEGDVHERIGVEAQDRGDYDLAAAEYHLAGQAYAIGLETARSDASLYRAECSRRQGVLEIAQARGQFLEHAYLDAIEVCEKALQANPDDAEAYVVTSDVYWRLSEQQVASGADPTLALRKNLEAASEAVRLLPDDARAHHALGISHTLAADRAISIGADPRASLAQAESNLARAVALDPGLGVVLQRAGLGLAAARTVGAGIGRGRAADGGAGGGGAQRRLSAGAGFFQADEEPRRRLACAGRVRDRWGPRPCADRRQGPRRRAPCAGSQPRSLDGFPDRGRDRDAGRGVGAPPGRRRRSRAPARQARPRDGAGAQPQPRRGRARAGRGSPPRGAPGYTRAEAIRGRRWLPATWRSGARWRSTRTAQRA